MKDKRLFLTFLAGGFLIRMLIVPFGGHPADIFYFAEWATAAIDHGMIWIYATSTANYPPLAMFLVGGAGQLAAYLRPGIDLNDLPLLWLTLHKLPAILADLWIGWLLYTVFPGRRSLWVAASIFFNPALILLSAWWGQLESVYMAIALAAVLATLRKEALIAGVLLGLGFLVKIPALAVAPVIGLIILSDSNWRGAIKSGIGFLAIIAMGVGPFIAVGQGKMIIAGTTNALGPSNWLTTNALNLWYLLTLGEGNWGYQKALILPDTDLLIWGLSYRMVGLIFFSVWTGLVLWMGWRRRHTSPDQVWLLVASLLILGMFLFPTQARERYLFGAVVMLGAWVASGSVSDGGWQQWGLYGMISLAHTINLLWAAAPFGWMWGWFSGNLGLGLGVSVSILLCAGWAWSVLYKVS